MRIKAANGVPHTSQDSSSIALAWSQVGQGHVGIFASAPPRPDAVGGVVPVVAGASAACAGPSGAVGAPTSTARSRIGVKHCPHQLASR